MGIRPPIQPTTNHSSKVTTELVYRAGLKGGQVTEMKAIRRLHITLVLLALPAALLFAQEGPYVPCIGCDERTQVTYPEPGHWYNPDQSGTGFNLEFQNGIMAGYYYGYDAEGKPEWYLVTNPLVRSETSGVMWELEVEPQRFTGGNCMGCPYQSPSDSENLPAVKIEFLQRAYARLTLSDGSIQYMVPFMYGEAGEAFYTEQTPYTFPRLVDNPYPSLWTLVFKPANGGEFEPWKLSSAVFIINEGGIEPGGNFEGMLYYRIDLPVNPPEGIVVIGKILCDLHETLKEPGCTLNISGSGIPRFQLSIGNFTDSRIFGEAEDGSTIEGYRLNYD